MFNYTNATLAHLPLKQINEPYYHDINYEVLASHVKLLKDHPQQDLPPIVIKNGDILDGRHRYIAYTHAERLTIPVIQINEKVVGQESNLDSSASSRNVDGSTIELPTHT